MPALDRISALGEKVSMRYALQLLAPASVLAKVSGREGGRIEEDDVAECEGLFLDARRSAMNLAASSAYIA